MLLVTVVPLLTLLGINLSSYVLYTLVDGQRRGFFKYLIGAIFCLMTCLLVIEMIASLIASIRVIVKVYSNKMMQQETTPLDLIRLSVRNNIKFF